MTVTTAPRTPLDTADVAALLLAAGDGDQRAWEELVRRYRGLVAAVVRSYRMQDADARDAEQRTWLRLVENRSRVRDPARLGGWLATTASRECLRILRDGGGTAAMDLDLLPDRTGAVEDQVVDADSVARIRRIIATLPDRGRAIMNELFADEPQHYAEISRITGVPVGSLGPSRQRLLQRVRRTFDEPVSA